MKKIAIIIALFILIPIILFLILDKLFPLDLKKLYPEFSQIIRYRDGTIARVFLTSDDKLRIPVSLDNLKEDVIKVLIASEDKRFYYHFGIDPFAIIRALWSNIKKGRIVSGASTITMQIARMIERKPRTLKSKIIEMFRAIQLELRFSKRELLEIYLNLAPFGGNIEGIASASYSYYNKPPSQLSPLEMVTLLAIPKQPSKLRPDKLSLIHI